MSKPFVTASADDLTARARLRDAAIRLFAERGVAGSPVRDIAEAAGVTAGLITHYFGSKAGLKAAVDERLVEVFTEPLGSLPGDSEAFAGAVSEGLAHQMGAHPELRAYLRRSFLENDPASFEVFDRFVTLLRDRLQEMHKAGLVREDLDLDWAPFQILFLHFGPLLLGPAIERALGVDSYAADVIRRRSHATMELLSRGIFSALTERITLTDD
jgi:TetR/AcrR family transcriptional regulator, regulator of cefoperazone and chloramphenicol sensitivity